MTDITKLPAKWRGGSTVFRYMSTKEILSACAEGLELSIPRWTLITKDKSTWPSSEGEVLISFIDGFGRRVFRADEVKLIQHYYETSPTTFVGCHWRPLCDLDSPPKEEK